MFLSLSSGQLMLTLAGIALSLVGIIILFRYRLIQSKIDTSHQSSVASERNKYPQANYFKLRSLFLKVGMITSLGLVILAFSWTSGAALISGNIESDIYLEEIEMIPRTKTPPKPEPPKPRKVEEVPEEDFPEEDTIEFVDDQIEDPDFISFYEAKQEVEPAPMPEAPPVVEVEEETEILIFAEEMPNLKSCADQGNKAERWACSQLEMLKYVNSQIRYPPLARENGIQGTVVVSFVINENGALDDITLVRDLEGGCGMEVMRIMDKMNKKLKWNPGRQRGKAVKVKVNLPVKFKLE